MPRTTCAIAGMILGSVLSGSALPGPSGAPLPAFGMAAAFAAADGAGSPRYGRQLAESLCGDCHRVSPNREPKPPPLPGDAEAPDLMERVRDPGITEMALRTYLRTSHPIMPNIRLNEEQTDDIVAYLLSLKGGTQ